MLGKVLLPILVGADLAHVIRERNSLGGVIVTTNSNSIVYVLV